MHHCYYAARGCCCCCCVRYANSAKHCVFKYIYVYSHPPPLFFFPKDRIEWASDIQCISAEALQSCERTINALGNMHSPTVHSKRKFKEFHDAHQVQYTEENRACYLCLSLITAVKWGCSGAVEMNFCLAFWNALWKKRETACFAVFHRDLMISVQALTPQLYRQRIDRARKPWRTLQRILKRHSPNLRMSTSLYWHRCASFLFFSYLFHN